MLKSYLFILFINIVLFSAFRVEGQVTMQDYACTGQTRHYKVDPNPVSGSTYTWWIDGVVQVGFTGNEFDHAWNTSNTYLLEVQERSADGCPGAKRSGQVIVTTCLIIPEAFSPNGDLINDVWNIGNIEAYTSVEITVFNRWGQSVWKSGQGYFHPWDGKSNGANLPIDSYYYVIDLHNGSKPIIGNVTIVR